MWKIIHYGCIFVYEKFHGQTPTKTSFLVLLLHFDVCDAQLQV
jgi:hypothetical protein